MKNLLLIAVLAAACSVRAQGTAEAISAYNQSAIAPPVSSTAGWTFEATTNLIALDLGCFTNVFLNNPSAAEVQVGLWASDGALLASTVVTLASVLADHSLYNAISPVFLGAGQIYHLGVFWPPDGGLILDAAVAGDFTASSDILVRGTALGTAGFAFPEEVQPPDGAIYAGANFRFQEGIPEPSSGLLVGLGGLLLAARRNWRRR
jgi:hypothetical protein